MLVIFNEFCTKIFFKINVVFVSIIINDYADIQIAVKDELKKADDAQLEDSNKAMKRLIDDVKEQNDVENKSMSTRLMINVNAFQVIRNKYQMMLKVCNE